MTGLPEGKKFEFIRFDRMHERDRHPIQRGRHPATTPHDGMGRAYGTVKYEKPTTVHENNRGSAIPRD